MSWEDSLILDRGEKIVQSWEGDHEHHMTVMVDTFLGKRPKTVKQSKKGILVLTNRKLVWLEQRGIFGKSYHSRITIPLEDVKGISRGGAIIKYVSITDSQGEHTFHLVKPRVMKDEEFDSFKQIIFEQVEARKREIEAMKRKERVHIMIDFSFLKNYMEKGGMILQTFKCPECGAPIKLPEKGNSTKCDHCGKVMYARDVFQKIKELIG